MRRAVPLLVLLLPLTACGPNPPAPVKVAALVPTATGLFTTTEVDLLTVTDVTALKGTAAELVGGAVVVQDPSDPLQNLNGGLQNQTDEQRFTALVKNAGLPVRASYIERAGVLWPADFHSWNMVTTYYNFERAYSYWVTVYAARPPPLDRPTELERNRVLYWPEVRLNSATPLTDNALYLSLIKSFVVVPQDREQLVPLAMNIGVIGHEVAHRVFGFTALGDRAIHPALVSWTGLPFNTLKSIDEGFADFHGYAVTCLEAAGCRPAFLNISLSDVRTVQNRDLSRPGACLDEATRNAYREFSPGQWVTSPQLYLVGNLWAAALYQAGESQGKRNDLERALLLAYDDESASRPGLRQLLDRNLNTPLAFTPEAVADVILAHIDDLELRRETCSQFLTRLQLKCTAGGPTLCQEMPACPVTAVRNASVCPTLPVIP